MRAYLRVEKGGDFARGVNIHTPVAGCRSRGGGGATDEGLHHTRQLRKNNILFLCVTRVFLFFFCFMLGRVNECVQKSANTGTNDTHLVRLLVSHHHLADGEPVTEGRFGSLARGRRVADRKDVLAVLVPVHLPHDAVVRLALPGHHVSHGGGGLLARRIFRLLAHHRRFLALLFDGSLILLGLLGAAAHETTGSGDTRGSGARLWAGAETREDGGGGVGVECTGGVSALYKFISAQRVFWIKFHLYGGGNVRR